MSARCDLHTHTTASDGQYTPGELVKKAKGHGLSILAVTDHDTIAGGSEAMAAGKAQGLRVIRGVELSADDYPNCARISTSWATISRTGTPSWPVCAKNSGRGGMSGSIRSWIFFARRVWTSTWPR